MAENLPIPTEAYAAGETLAVLESRLAASRNEVVAAREILAVARAGLEAVEDTAKRSWRRRKAAQDSLRITENTALACGLSRSLSTKLAVSRFKDRIDTEIQEFRVIVESANAVCQEFYAAWELVRAARREEAIALGAIIEANVIRDASVPRVEQRRVEQRRQEARGELKELERTRDIEDKERRKDFAVDSDGHFDPDYDDWEIELRKNRPWLSP